MSDLSSTPAPVRDGTAGDHFSMLPGPDVLVIAPHPDDETLGCGGTIARLAAAGHRVHVLAVTVRVGRMWGGHSDGDVRTSEFKLACSALGVTSAELAWRDEEGSLDITTRQRDLVNLIERDSAVSLAAVRPATALIPAAGGFHQDHQAVHRAAFAACRVHSPDLKPTPRAVLGYSGAEEAWSSHAEPWRVHVDISAHWEAKEEALRAYGTQMRPDGNPRSIAQVRRVDAAAGGSLGMRYAETFVPYRLSV
ncbi:PIG-L deacetylase family protein [Streptomyces coelicoflavus]|uniref:PIG-L deacetylase family protein n=1 Tax=Streptomyces coelicoflavus TaxID=285562 RepID=UPI000247570D|nr:hypothetical protein SMCF_1394 [Streptomyces coelicoflavus ZG0656]